MMRYFISSNSPSGGMKLIVRSCSNCPNFTQRWNVTSSMAMPEDERRVPAFLFFSLSITSLSFMPNLHSGMPDR